MILNGQTSNPISRDKIEMDYIRHRKFDKTTNLRIIKSHATPNKV